MWLLPLITTRSTARSPRHAGRKDGQTVGVVAEVVASPAGLVPPDVIVVSAGTSVVVSAPVESVVVVSFLFSVNEIMNYKVYQKRDVKQNNSLNV